jgi:hypothetical protein
VEAVVAVQEGVKMEPATDLNVTVLVPNEIAVFEEDLSHWASAVPVYVGPVEGRMKKWRKEPATLPPTEVLPAVAMAADPNSI